MFVEVPNRQDLRQGDIVQGFYFPHLTCSQIQILGSPPSAPTAPNGPLNLTAKAQKQFLNASIQVQRSYCIVLSQCCDLIHENGKLKLPAFVLSPLMDVPYQIRNDNVKLTALKKNEPGKYVNLFYIPQVSPLPQDYVVDFVNAFSVLRADLKFALDGKVLQMKDEARVSFKVKLGLHFARPTQEELDQKLFPDS